jgi:hypothetical protein
VYSEKLLMMDRGTVRKTCRVPFHYKIEKLVHLVGFIISIRKNGWLLNVIKILKCGKMRSFRC